MLDRASLSELNKAREKFPQTHRNLVHLGPERGLFCARCGTKANPGGGDGQGFGYSYYYCCTCDEFVEWSDFGLTEETRAKYQAMTRNKIRELEEA